MIRAEMMRFYRRWHKCPFHNDNSGNDLLEMGVSERVTEVQRRSLNRERGLECDRTLYKASLSESARSGVGHSDPVE